MARPTSPLGKSRFSVVPLPWPRRVRGAAAFAALLAAYMVPGAIAQAGGPPDDNGGSGFALVAQALRARLHLIYIARQDILWATASPTEGMAQVVADIARAGGRTSITYRFPTEAAGRVTLDDGVRSWLYDPAHRALIIDRSTADDRSAAAPETLALLRRNYDCLRLSREALNGCLCDVIAVCPRAPGGPSKRLWIETTRHAVLRTEEYDAQGCRRYVSFYEAIRFLPRLPAAALALPVSARDAATRRVSVHMLECASAPQAFAAAGLAGRVPAWCPGGFTLMRCSVINPRSEAGAVLLHYSDGLKSLLVMEEPRTGTHPTASELSRALARYGQQAWVREDGPLRTVVRGDLSLPDSLGAEMLQALSAWPDAVLARGLARDFGASAARRGAALRRRGWGYERIGALCLWEKRHPRQSARIKPLVSADAPWPQFVRVFGAEAVALENRGRAWVSATLAVTR